MPNNTTTRRNSVLRRYLLTCQRYRHRAIDIHQLQADTWLTSISLEDDDPRLSDFLALADLRLCELADRDPLQNYSTAMVLVEAAEKLTLKRVHFR